jgi:UrcA family protein
MNMTDKILKISLFAVLAFSQTPAFAEDGPMVVEGKSVFQERVGYRDLDLRVGEDQRILRKRVFAASDRVCVAADGPNYRSNVTMSGSARVPGGLNCCSGRYRDWHQTRQVTLNLRYLRPFSSNRRNPNLG